ncbi:MAG: DUF58 domain-containing protein [Planctomycetota bacterium]
MAGSNPTETAAPGTRHLDPKTLDKIKRLDVKARLVVEGFISGQHRSPYNGFAIEFAAHREYSPGDDLRHIDWKVWSKTDRLYIKEYEEETNLKCQLIVDASKSMRYGETTGWSKFDYAATAAASLAYMLQQQADSVGMVLFSNKIDKSFKASSHPSHLKMLLHELEQTVPDDTTDVSAPFMQLASQIRQRGMVAIFSDLFLDPDELGESLNQFRLRRNEVIVFHVMHADELNFPFQDNTLFRGMEVDAELHTEPRALRASYLEAVERYMARVKKVCATAGIDHVLLDTSKPLDGVLSSYLNFRARSRRKLI